MNEDNFHEWAILELMGHVKLAGLVSEEERFGAKLGRIDIPDGTGSFTTQYFGVSSVYRLTPTTEEIARIVAVRNKPEPVYRWELALPVPAQNSPEPDEDDQDDEDDDELF